MLTNQVHTPRSPGSSQRTRIPWLIAHGYRKSLQRYLSRLWYKDTLVHSFIPLSLQLPRVTPAPSQLERNRLSITPIEIRRRLHTSVYLAHGLWPISQRANENACPQVSVVPANMA